MTQQLGAWCWFRSGLLRLLVYQDTALFSTFRLLVLLRSSVTDVTSQLFSIIWWFRPWKLYIFWMYIIRADHPDHPDYLDQTTLTTLAALTHYRAIFPQRACGQSLSWRQCWGWWWQRWSQVKDIYLVHSLLNIDHCNHTSEICINLEQLRFALIKCY